VLIVCEAIIDDQRRQNTFGLLMSLNMLIETQAGFDFTGADCSGWMRDSRKHASNRSAARTQWWLGSSDLGLRWPEQEGTFLAMPKTRKNVDENFKVAAVQRLQSGGVPANNLAKELGVSIWSLRKWSRQYRKKAAAGAGAAREPAAAPKELPAKPSSEPPVAPPAFEDGLIATIERIELEISALDKQREALKIAVEILRQRSGATPE
jgi:transposase-like protein